MLNPALRRLGYSTDDRVVVVNADDVGMCGATVDAFFELAGRGGVALSGSAMVPCPWFPAVAAGCRSRADLDVGVHLTLTSEWHGYRWGPVSTRDPASGLIDAEGYFFRSQDLWRGIDPDAVGVEIEVQLDRALTAGIDVTHLDSHMFSILHPSVVAQYVATGLARRIPVLMTRQPQWVAALSGPAIAEWEEQGLPVFDHLRETSLTGPDAHRLEVVERLFDELAPGLTFLLTHPATDTPELRAIAGDWRHRVADFQALGDPSLGRHLRQRGVHVVGWRPLRELMRSGATSVTAAER